MQYKIPVQIENEDPIIIGLSLRQLMIVMIGGWIWYSMFTALAKSISPEIAAIPGILVFLLAFAIAKFKIAEMSFMQFVLSFIRLKSNLDKRNWQKWVDSFPAIDIGFISINDKKKVNTIDMSKKNDSRKNMNDQIDKL